jgi:hypothetical protein
VLISEKIDVRSSLEEMVGVHDAAHEVSSFADGSQTKTPGVTRPSIVT